MSTHFPLLPFAFCLMPTSVKPKGVEHPETQKGADGASHSLVWYLGNEDGPPCPTGELIFPIQTDFQMPLDCPGDSGGIG